MPEYPKQIRTRHIRRAIEELGIDRPVYAHRIVGNRLELLVYGHDEPMFWPPVECPQPKTLTQPSPMGRGQEEGEGERGEPPMPPFDPPRASDPPDADPGPARPPSSSGTRPAANRDARIQEAGTKNPVNPVNPVEDPK